MLEAEKNGTCALSERNNATSPKYVRVVACLSLIRDTASRANARITRTGGDSGRISATGNTGTNICRDILGTPSRVGHFETTAWRARMNARLAA